MEKIAIIGLIMLLNFVAFAQIPSDANLRILINSLSETNVSLIVSNTQEDVLYEVQLKQNKTNWVSLGFQNGSEIINCMSFTSWFPREFTTNSHIPVTAKSIRVRSWQDSSHGATGGMADWWQIKYFGDINVDGFANPMGDGWFTMSKWQKGMNPFKWYPPPEPKAQFPYNNPPSCPKPLPFTELSEITTATISNTILSVTAKQQTNGYELIIRHPIVHARYLLLVRDKNDRQWRASGYFVSGTNRNPVHLRVDKRGMMTDAQSPIALPAVKFLPDVVQPEFTAGWGEDTDGDGLPDIYEVLVTHTKPDDPDTGDTGIFDGFKVFADDGWNNWGKFRYRANPFKKCEPPPAIVLKEPTISEMREVQTPKTDLPFEARLEIRTNSAADFQPYSLLNDQYLSPSANGHARCDVRVSWIVPSPKP
jgi:hypothetical protein